MPERVSGPPPLMLPGAALGSLAARFCWQGQHFRLWTVPERVSGPPFLMLPGAAPGSLQALDGARVSGPPPLDAARRSTWEPRGSFLLAGQHFRLWTVPERVSGPPALTLPGAALGSLAARFCWQGQHFRLWTVPERVSGPCQAQHLGASRLVSAGRGSTSGSGRYPSAFRGPPPPLMLPGAALGLAPPLLDAARRSTWEPRGSFLLAGAALQALDGARARFGAPSLMLPGAALGSLAAQVLDSLEPAGRFCHRCQHLLLNVVASLRGFWFLLQPEFCAQWKS